MSVYCSTHCVDCNEIAPEMGDGGAMGAPTLEILDNCKDLQYSFGWIYDGLKSIDLLPLSVESYKLFLERHIEHQVFLGNDHMDPDEWPAIDENTQTKFNITKDGFTKGFFEVRNAITNDFFQTTYNSEYYKNFETRTLKNSEIKNFLNRLSSPGCFYSFHCTMPSVNPNEDLGKLIEFFNANKEQDLTVSIRSEAEK